MTLKRVVECDNCHQTVDHHPSMFTDLHHLLPPSLRKWLRIEDGLQIRHYCDEACAVRWSPVVADREKV